MPFLGWSGMVRIRSLRSCMGALEPVANLYRSKRRAARHSCSRQGALAQQQVKLNWRGRLASFAQGQLASTGPAIKGLRLARAHEPSPLSPAAMKEIAAERERRAQPVPLTQKAAPAPWVSLPNERGPPDGPTQEGPPVSSHQPAAGARIGQVLGRDAHDLVLPAFGSAQIDVLRDVLRRRHGDGSARGIDLGRPQRLIEIGFVLDVAADRLESQGQQLAGIVALHGVDIGIATGLVLESPAEADVLCIVETVAVMQRGLDALSCRPLCFGRALGQEARATQRYFETCCRVLLDELYRTAASEEGAHHIDAEPRDLRQERLEVGLWEGQGHIGEHLATALLEGLFEARSAFSSSRIIPRQPYGFLVALLSRSNAHAVRRLPIGEGAPEYVLGAQLAGDCNVPGIGYDGERAALRYHLVDSHLHARVNRADQDIDLVTLDQAVGVLRRDFRLGFIVELNDLQLAPAKLAALFGDQHLNGEGDVLPELGERARVGEHQPYLQRLGLCDGPAGRHARRGGERGAARDHGAARKAVLAGSGHFVLPRFVVASI